MRNRRKKEQLFIQLIVRRQKNHRIIFKGCLKPTSKGRFKCKWGGRLVFFFLNVTDQVFKHRYNLTHMQNKCRFIIIFCPPHKRIVRKMISEVWKRNKIIAGWLTTIIVARKGFLCSITWLKGTANVKNIYFAWTELKMLDFFKHGRSVACSKRVIISNWRFYVLLLKYSHESNAF